MGWTFLCVVSRIRIYKLQICFEQKINQPKRTSIENINFTLYTDIDALFTDMTTFVLKEAAIHDPAYCPNKCGRSYKGHYRRVSLRRHMLYECGALPRFPCDVCKKQFYRRYQLTVHSATVHKLLWMWNISENQKDSVSHVQTLLKISIYFHFPVL